jgi:hypothetical protein
MYEGEVLKNKLPEEGHEINHDDDYEWIKEGFLPG